MEISSLNVRRVTMPRVDPTWRTASYALDYVEADIIELGAGGQIGIGALGARPPGKGTPIGELEDQLNGPARQILIGADPLGRTALNHRLREASLYRSVTTALDIALHDLLGKLSNMPCHALWGGAVRRELPVLRMVGLKAPGDLVEAVGEFIDQGFTHFKVKVGTRPEEDAARIRALRGAYGDTVWLSVDGNGAYTTDEAIELSRALDPFDVKLIEQPIDYNDLEGLARLTAHSTIPIMADQYVTGMAAAVEICKRQAAHMVSVKAGQTGTLDECRAVAETCLGFGVRVHVGGSAHPGIIDAAQATLVATIPGIEAECEVGECLAIRDDPTGGVPIRNGSYHIGDEAGFGIALT